MQEVGRWCRRLGPLNRRDVTPSKIWTRASPRRSTGTWPCWRASAGSCSGWLIQGEVFPTAVRGRAAATAACVDWLANYALIEAFPIWHNSIGLAWTMVSFAVLCVVAIGFVYRFLPETRELSVEQAVHVFER